MKPFDHLEPFFVKWKNESEILHFVENVKYKPFGAGPRTAKS